MVVMRDLSRFRALFLTGVALVAAVTLTACTGGGTTDDAQTPTPTPGPAFALSDLLTADVPSMCEHPAGALVDGALPGIAEMEGRVTLSPLLLEDLQAGAEESDLAVIGTDAEGEPFLAATLYCDRGGVSWPSQVVVWDAEMTPVTAFHPEELTGGDREQVAGISATETGFSARWTAPNEFDAACCHQLSAETDVEVSLADASVTPAEPVIHRGEEQVRAVAEAALAGTTVDGIEVEEGLYEGIALVIEKGGEYDLDGITCRDTGDSEASTLICGIPVQMNGTELAFVIYPTLSAGWDQYALTHFDRELW